MILLGHIQHPNKKDLKPFDIVRSARGDIGIVSRDLASTDWTNTDTNNGGSRYGIPISHYTDMLVHSNSEHTITEIIRIPNVVFSGS